MNSREHKIRACVRELQGLLPKALPLDREAVGGKLKSVIKGKSKIRDMKRLERQLEEWRHILVASASKKSRRRSQIPSIVYPQHLPIVSKRAQIVEAIMGEQVVIISGETGSGKSTQISKMCLEAGRGVEGMIGCTQPRRIAATTIAHRIAEELGEPLGASVGYKIRFTDRVSPDAYIKIMTDGILLAEAQSDRNLYQYDTIIIDEAHERSVNIDLLLGLLKRLLSFRKDLRVIISSATLETEKFSSFFNDAPVIEVSGKLFPVEVNYWLADGEAQEDEDSTYVDMALDAVDQIRSEDPRGDILVFMPTEQDIMETCERMKGRLGEKENILPLFARLPWAQQKKIYKVKGPKVVVATNVAETSLTIPGIRYVVDTGLARISRYLPRTRTTSLPISPISKASAEQRKGRCGRVQRGVCIRLYSEEDFENRPPYTTPEILRSNLAEVILRMIYLRLGDMKSFPFLDRPNPKSIKDGFDLLVELGAIKRDGGEVYLTDLGRKMARLPLDPRISRMLLEARGRDCMAEMAVISAALSIQDPRERPAEKAHEADQARSEFQDPDSEFISLIKLWTAYRSIGRGRENLSSKRRFCRDHFLSYVRMRQWEDVHNQILAILREYGYSKRKGGGKQSSASLYERIHKCILSGFLSNIAVKKSGNLYQGTKGKEVMIFPGSSLFKKGPDWIVAAEMVKTSRLFARTVARVEPQWIEDVGGELCKRAYSNPRWSRARGRVVASEQVSLFGLIISSGRVVDYGPLDPEQAHDIFISEALMQGDIRERLGFLEHNKELRERLSVLEHKLRRRGIIAGEERIKRFYSERLTGVFDLAGLRKRINEKGGDDFLRLKDEDLMVEEPEDADLKAYPDRLVVGDSSFKLSYAFCPGKESDGVTVNVPASMASEFPLTQLDWIVPGLLREKVREMIKALPKGYRRRLIPLDQSVDSIVADLRNRDEPLATALSSIIEERFGLLIPPRTWSTLKIPEHLRLRIRVVDPGGREIVSGRGAWALQQVKSMSETGLRNTEAWERARSEWEQDDLKRWNFGDLPEKILVTESIMAYPALKESDGKVNIRLFPSLTEASSQHVKGVRALSCLELAKELRAIKKTLRLPEHAKPLALYFGGEETLDAALFDHLTRSLFAKNIRSEKAYYQYLSTARKELYAFAKELLEICVVILSQYHAARETVKGVAKANPQNSILLQICKDIKLDLATLVPREFLAIYDLNRLKQLPRYLKAAIIRSQRAAYDPQKDRAKAKQLEEPLQYLREMMQELSTGCSEEKQRAIEAYRWAVEEFKISLFAQEMGTQYPVSLQRLRKSKKEIDMMI